MAYGNDNAYDWKSNSSYGSYGGLLGKNNKTQQNASKSVAGAANWKQQRNQRLAEQTWRAQEQRQWWANQGRDAGLNALNQAQWAGNEGYDKGLAALNNWGDQITSGYSNARNALTGARDRAYGQYDQQVAMGDQVAPWLMENYNNPLMYEQYMTGALADDYLAREAEKRVLQERNARGSLGIESRAAGLKAYKDQRLSDQMTGYGMSQDALTRGMDIWGQGLAGRNARANIDNAYGGNMAGLYTGEVGDRGQLANSLYTGEVNRGLFNSNMAGQRGALESDYAAFSGDMARGDFDWWKNNENIDNQITRGQYDNERVYNQMMAQQDKGKWNDLLGVGLKGLASVATGGTSSIAGKLLGLG